MYATVNVKTMLLDFFNYQLSSSLSGYKFCYMFLCPCVYKISKFAHNTYTKIRQATKAKMFVNIGFVNSYTAVTTNGNISN